MQIWLSSFDDLNEIFAIGSVITVTLLALIIGGVQERLASVIALFDTFGVVLMNAFFDRQSAIFLIEIKATIVLVAYSAMSWRWAKAWLIALTAFQAVAILMLLGARVEGSILLNINVLLRNIIGWLMLLTLAVATVQAARLRWSNRARDWS